MHSLTGHVNQVVFSLSLGGVSIGDFEDDSPSFFLDMVEEILRGIQQVDQEVNSLFFLDTVENGQRGSAAGDLGNVCAVLLEGICVTTESKSLLPTNPSCHVRTVSEA